MKLSLGGIPALDATSLPPVPASFDLKEATRLQNIAERKAIICRKIADALQEEITGHSVNNLDFGPPSVLGPSHGVHYQKCFGELRKAVKYITDPEYRESFSRLKNPARELTLFFTLGWMVEIGYVLAAPVDQFQYWPKRLSLSPNQATQEILGEIAAKSSGPEETKEKIEAEIQKYENFVTAWSRYAGRFRSQLLEEDLK